MDEWVAFILTFIVVAVTLWVLFLGPLYALMSLLRSASNRRGFTRFCREVGVEYPQHHLPTRLSPRDHPIFALLYSPHRIDKELGESRIKLPSVSTGEPDLADFPRLNASSEGILAVWVECDLPCSFALTRESFYDTLSKTATLDREFQTGDPEFDRSVFISCENAAFVRRYFTLERRKVFLAILGTGISQVRYVKGSRRLIFFSDPDYFRRSDVATPSCLINILEALAEDNFSGATAVVSPMVKHRPPRVTSLGQPWRNVASLLIILMCLSVASSNPGYVYRIPSGEPIFATTAAVCAGTMAVLLLWRARRVRGTSTARQSLVRFVLWSILVIPLFIWPTLIIGNRVLDFSAPYDEPAKFRGIKLRSPVRKPWSRTPYPVAEFIIERREGESEHLEFRVPDELVESLKVREGHSGKVRLKRGAFGLDYGIDFSVEP